MPLGQSIKTSSSIALLIKVFTILYYLALSLKLTVMAIST